MEYQEGDIILCTVTNIERTTVFVKTEDGIKGSITFSEIAPGRIRNIREYVVPKKTIVCKILNIKDNHLFLSLRRVKNEERKELLEENKKEKSLKAILKTITKNHEEIINAIKKEKPFMEFFEDARKNPEILNKYFKKEEIEKIKKILEERKEKKKEIKKEFKLSSQENDGIMRIKKILSPYDNITYLGSSRFQIKILSDNPKKTGNQLNEMFEEIEKEAKKQKCFFEIKK